MLWTELTCNFLVDKFAAHVAKEEFVQTEAHLKEQEAADKKLIEIMGVNTNQVLTQCAEHQLMKAHDF